MESVKTLIDTDIHGNNSELSKLKDRDIKTAQALMQYSNGSPAYNRRLHRTGKNMLGCSTKREYLTDLSTGAKRLIHAKFCRSSLCNICEHRRYNHDSARLYSATQYIEDSGMIPTKPVYLLLTPTIKNVDGEHIHTAINLINYALNKMLKYKAIDKYVYGTIKRIEEKSNMTDGTYNVHAHLLLLVKPTFYNGKARLNHSQWSKYWNRALKADYNADINVQRVKQGEINRAIHYLVLSNKDLDKLQDDTATDKTIEQVIDGVGGMYRKHLLTLTGVIKKADNIANQSYKRHKPDTSTTNTGKHEEYSDNDDFNYSNAIRQVFSYKSTNQRGEFYQTE